jgi:peptidyl-prolyl cis-trans isomerase SurA
MKIMKIMNKLLIIFFLIIFNNVNALENKIILKVNNDIITSLDVFEEINRLKFFNKNLNQLKKEEVYQISLQSVLKYRIKQNEVIKNFKEVKFDNKDYLNTLIENTYKNLGFKNLTDFKNELNINKISYELFVEKLKVDILWNRIIFLKYSDKIIINENELKNQIQNRSTYKRSFELKEIVFSVTNVNDLNSIYQLIKKDIDELGFENAAIKHSISNTAKDGGNIGWIDENQLNNEIKETLNEIPNGSITKPIRIASGFAVLKKINVKKEQNNLDFDQELNKLINFQKQTQLENYSNIYFNKVKKDIKINAP